MKNASLTDGDLTNGHKTLVALGNDKGNLRGQLPAEATVNVDVNGTLRGGIFASDDTITTGSPGRL